jgi:hypothetical protein
MDNFYQFFSKEEKADSNASNSPTKVARDKKFLEKHLHFIENIK